MDTFLCKRLKTPEEKREEKGQRERERGISPWLEKEAQRPHRISSTSMYGITFDVRPLTGV